MPLSVTITDVQQVEKRLWKFSLPPNQVRQLGETARSGGERSVIVFSKCDYDPKIGTISFSIDQSSVANVGTSNEVIGIDVSQGEKRLVDYSINELEAKVFGPGDLEYLTLARSEMSEEMASVAYELLLKIRSKWPGNLHRGKKRNFSETPDNFWYVILQPRIQEMQITVRGSKEHFSGVNDLEIKDDRGNTRFKVRSHDDIEAAVQLVEHAVRKS